MLCDDGFAGGQAGQSEQRSHLLGVICSSKIAVSKFIALCRSKEVESKPRQLLWDAFDPFNLCYASRGARESLLPDPSIFVSCSKEAEYPFVSPLCGPLSSCAKRRRPH